jgi:hypothetical protein
VARLSAEAGFVTAGSGEVAIQRAAVLLKAAELNIDLKWHQH